MAALALDQSGTVHQAIYDPSISVEMIQDEIDLLTCSSNRQPLRASGTNDATETSEFAMQNMPVKKGVERRKPGFVSRHSLFVSATDGLEKCSSLAHPSLQGAACRKNR